MERFNLISWTVQVDRIKEVAKRFDVQTIVVDQTGVGDPIVEQLHKELPEIIHHWKPNLSQTLRQRLERER